MLSGRLLPAAGRAEQGMLLSVKLPVLEKCRLKNCGLAVSLRIDKAKVNNFF